MRYEPAIPPLIELIGGSSVAPLAELLVDPSVDHWSRSSAATALARIVILDASRRDAVADIFGAEVAFIRN